MANVTRSALSATSSLNFPDNTSQLISPLDLREWLTDGIDSFVTQKDKSTLENAIYEAEGSPLPSGSVVLLSNATGNFVHITGNTTITSFGTCPAGARFVLVFDGVLTLTHNATSLILPGSANITTAAGDCCMIISEGSGNWRVIGYFPAAGGGGGGTVTSVTATTPLSSTGGSAPDISIQQASGSQDGYLDSTDWSTFNNKQDALSAGTGISIVSNTVTNTAPDQIVVISSGTGISATGTYPNFTIANTAPSSGGTVTSIATSSPITGGTITGSGTIGIQDAAADGSTKGAAAFTASDFNATSGVISIDYTNGQAASGSNKGFLTSGDWTTFNNKGNGTVQSVSGTGTVNGISLSGTVTGTGNLTLGGTLSGVSLTSQVSGTLPVGNGGTGQTSYTDGQLLIGNTATGGLTKATLTQGSGVTITNGNGTITIAATGGGGGSGTVNSGTSTRLAYYAATGTAVSETTNMAIDNTNGRLNVGGTGVPTARVQTAAGTAANGQLLLTPSVLGSGGLTGTTDGMMWYDTTSNNSTLYLRKLYAAATSILTKFITLDRNPDFATGSGSGIIQADANGTLSKGSDLTALGIYAETAGTTVQNTTTTTSLIGTVTGSTTLPANFFGVGKTITIFASGTYQQTSSANTCTVALTIGGVSIGSFALSHTNAVGPVYWDAQWTITCRTTGTTGTVQYNGKSLLNISTSSNNTYFITSASATINTTTTNVVALTGTWSATNPSNILITSIHYGNYLN